MASLDRFKVVHHAPTSDCCECDCSGDVFAFWETHRAADDGQSPDYTVCARCLFAQTGRFKNQHPAEVLRVFEEITSINVYDGHVEIGTRSPFGYFFHVHYTTPALTQAADPRDNTDPVYEIRQQLTGESEIFREEDIAIADHSPYSELARRALAKHEAESSARNT